MELLTACEMSVGEIAGRIQIAQSSASQHLAVLQRAGLISHRAQGTMHLYHLRGPRVPKILMLIEEFCQVHGLEGYPAEEAASE